MDYDRERPVTAWPSAAEMTLSLVAARWSRVYAVGFNGRAYCAIRADWTDEVPPLTASTPEGLDSAIRANYARWSAS